MTISRRAFIRNGTLAGVGVVASAGFLDLLTASGAPAAPSGGYGPLVPDPDGLVDLPRGFSYRVLAKGGPGWTSGYSTYDDGTKVPGDPDGAASFRSGRGGTILTYNHELSGGEDDPGVPHVHGGRPVPTYDPEGRGGCSSIELDRRGDVVARRPVIAGTVNNCAGGLTPWGTWLTCEETTATRGDVMHGYVFEVDPAGERTVAEPILGMGRFPHEAVVIDPQTGSAYLTEDNDQVGLVYRYEPDDRRRRYGSLHAGGTLTAMRIEGVDTASEITEVGVPHRVSWTPVPRDVDPTTTTELAESFPDDVVTRSRKWEGAWFGRGRAYFAASYQDDFESRTAHHGQVFAYDPERETIELVLYIPVDDPAFDSPDNIAIAPDGSLWIAEDGDDDQHISVMDADGALAAFARNATRTRSELTGVHFSPGGSTLFFSMQEPGTTFAVTGPFGVRGPGGARRRPVTDGRGRRRPI